MTLSRRTTALVSTYVMILSILASIYLTMPAKSYDNREIRLVKTMPNWIDSDSKTVTLDGVLSEMKSKGYESSWRTFKREDQLDNITFVELSVTKLQRNMKVYFAVEVGSNHVHLIDAIIDGEEGQLNNARNFFDE